MLAEVMMEEPGLGLSGLVAVVGYLLVGWLCLRAFMVEKAGPRRPYLKSLAALWRVVKKHWPSPPTPARRAALWACLAIMLIALGINRLFDIETLLLDWWREDSRQMGTYAERRAMQGGFVGAVGLLGLVVVVGLFRIARGQLADFRLVIGGAVFLVAFVVVRAASLHAIDGILRTRVAGMPLAFGLEALGLGVVGVAAIGRLRRAGEQAKAAAPPGQKLTVKEVLTAVLGGVSKGKKGSEGSGKGAAPAALPSDDSAPIKITQLDRK